jgi:uncharacterized protein (TIGR00369 family)
MTGASTDHRILHEPVRGAIGDRRAFQLPGLEAVRRYLRDELPAPPIWRLTGLRATDAGIGRATFSMPITGWLEDGFGVVWAGAFALLADAPLGVSIWTGLPAGKTVTTSELNLSFVRPFTRDTGNIVGRASSVHQGRQVGLSAVEISDRKGRTMGYGTTRCLIVDVPVDPDADYPAPDLGPADPPDPFRRAPPTDARFDLPSILNGEPIDILQRVAAQEFVPNTLRMNGGTYLEIDRGRVVCSFPTSSWFSAGGPALYGGAVAWLAEFTMGSAVYSTLGPGSVFATLDMNVRFTRPALINSGDLRVTAQVQHEGRRLRIASAEVIAANGKRIAMATSSALVVPGGINALIAGHVPDEVLQD